MSDVYDISNFDFSIIKLENPVLINNNNYFSKISIKNNKNLYIQLSKCNSKQGLNKSNNKYSIELNFNMYEKEIIQFFENLEKYCIDKIYDNKSLWFYEPDNINKTDIEEFMTTPIKPYKHGKNFLIKTYIKIDKFNIYDENESLLSIDDFKDEYEFIPLININGLKFTNKNFTFELLLPQIMILYPSDNYEKQLLIKIDKKDTIFSENNNISNKINTEEKKIHKEEKNEKEDEKEEKNIKEDKKEYEKEEEKEDNIKLNLDLDNNDEKNKCHLNDKNFGLLLGNDLEELNLDDDLLTDEPIELKSHNEIYLEIYKNAKKKAKEIRQNALEAFLEAKNIKIRYNLQDIEDSDTDDEINFK